ncbi:MAG: ABC transporter substrate-binding protein [Proteobacteria bacterium]|nr:ABC transporter substrate-binding protein [Pseudomonadota bacterium]
MISRRRIVSGLACALGTTALAQTPGRTYHIGYLGFAARETSTPDYERAAAAFRNRLNELGFVEGRNLTIDRRYAEGTNDRYVEFAAEMREKGVDLIFTGSAPAVRAVVDTSSIPVVIFAISDPLHTGMVASYAHPGGQVTGMSNFNDDLVPKRIELFKAAVPTLSRMAIARCTDCALLSGISRATWDSTFESYSETAHSLGITLIPADINAGTDFRAGVNLITSAHADGVLISSNPINVKLQEDWVAFEAVSRMPAMADNGGFGCLLSYGPDYPAMLRRVAEIVAQILNGAKPGDLPLERPTKFEFVINLKVARAIGLVVPQSVLARADHVVS